MMTAPTSSRRHGYLAMSAITGGVLTRSSPSLWASLYVDLASPPVRNLLAIFLSLSTNVPLDITLNVREIGDEGKEVLHNDIIPLSHLWSNLRIMVTKDTIFEFLPIADRLPILKFLHISVSGCWPFAVYQQQSHSYVFSYITTTISNDLELPASWHSAAVISDYRLVPPE